MLLECLDVDKIAYFHVDHTILEPQLGRAFQDDDPFMLGLVVPEVGRRRVTVRDDPFDANVFGSDEDLDEFFGEILRQIVEDVDHVLADLLAARSQGLKTRRFATFDPHRLGEHRLWADPKSVISVLLPVDDEFFERLAMTRRADHGVLVSLVMPIATARNFTHARILSGKNPSPILGVVRGDPQDPAVLEQDR